MPQTPDSKCVAPGAQSSLRDVLRRTVYVWGILLGVAGFTLTFFASDSEDPCCHVQAPGFLVAGLGMFPMATQYVRRRKFHDLLAAGSGHHAFRDVEDELDRLSKLLPSSFRQRFLDARAQYAGSTSRRGHRS